MSTAPNPWKWRIGWIAMTLVAATMLALMIDLDIRPAAPDPMYPAPGFALIDQDGEPFGSEQLLGSPYVVAFIFTRCRAVCPIMTMQMAMLQDQLDGQAALDDVKLVSVSVDPDYDTPEVLTAFAERYHADPARWRFLTGPDRSAVWPMVEEGFKLPLEDTPENTAMPISHSSKLVLVDGAGMIRGYYSGTDGEGQAALMDALHAVVRESD